VILSIWYSDGQEFVSCLRTQICHGPFMNLFSLVFVYRTYFFKTNFYTVVPMSNDLLRIQNQNCIGTFGFLNLFSLVCFFTTFNVKLIFMLSYWCLLSAECISEAPSTYLVWFNFLWVASQAAALPVGGLIRRAGWRRGMLILWVILCRRVVNAHSLQETGKNRQI
jgi:hypothetical protein